MGKADESIPENNSLLRRFLMLQNLREHGIILWMLSIITTIGLTCSMSADPHFIHDPALSDETTAYQFYIYAIRCLTERRILACLVAIGMRRMLSLSSQVKSDSKGKKLAFIFCALFAPTQLLGHSYMNANSWDEVFGNTFCRLRAVVFLVAYMTISYHSVLFAFHSIDKESEMANLPPRRVTKKSFLLIMSFIILCWLPYYVYFYPGTSNPDTSEQIAWTFHHSTERLLYSSVRGDNIFVSNHHPYFSTLIIGLFAKIGVSRGDIQYGIALYCFLQMLLTAFVFTAIGLYLAYVGLNKRIVCAGLCFVALFPLFPMYSICMVKDSLFSLACLSMTLLLFEIVRTKGASLDNRTFFWITFINAMLVMLTKNQGVFLILFAGILSLCFCRKSRIFSSMLLPVLIFQIVWVHILLPAWNVAPGGKQEVLGLLFQQTARCVSTYPADISKEEEAAIRNVLDYDRLTELYNPTLADPVKYTYNQDADKKQLSQYLKVWAKMFFRHPDAYFQALFNNVYGSFYLESYSVLVYLSFDNRDVEDYPELCVSKNSRIQNVEKLKYTLPQLIQSIPFVGILFSVGFYPWIILFCLFNALRKGRYALVAPLSLTLLSIGILLVSPVSGSFRYNMPLLYVSPLLLGICFLRMTGLSSFYNRLTDDNRSHLYLSQAKEEQYL